MELFRNVCNRIIVVGLFFRVAVLLETGGGWVRCARPVIKLI